MTESTGSTPQAEGRRGPHLEIDVFAREGQLKEGHVEQWGKHFTVMCDEGARVGGDDTAPSPLAYFTIGIGF